MPDAAPALGAVALFASSSTRIFGAAHLRAKESDRIAGLAAGLGSLGARVEEHRDGLTIHPGALRPATLDPLGDHRLAMAFAVAGLGIGDVTVLDPGCVAKSYPGFFDELDRITRTPS
jgi:3-phosphoshikimate 1-carboxyvinyltransferase